MGGGCSDFFSSLGPPIWALNLSLREISAHLMQKISESPGIALKPELLQTKLGMVWFGVVCLHMVWFDLVWFGLLLYGLVWLGMSTFCLS